MPALPRPALPKPLPRHTILCVHSSDEMYGADRVLLQVVAAVPDGRSADVQVWLPAPEPGPVADPAPAKLSDELTRRGIASRSRTLPVLRRRLMSASGILVLLRQVAAVVPALVRLRPQVLYCSTSAVLLLAPVARLLGVPRVVLHVQEIWSGPEAVLLRLLARFATDWVAISEASAASLPAGLRARVTVIPNGVEDPVPSLKDHAAEGPVLFLMAGRWNSWKGHRTLLEAWDDGEPPGELIILGGPPAAGAAADVRAMVAGLRYPETVRIVGEVPDITPYLDAADVMVVPSAAPEPFGLVAIEAFARRRPVIGSRGGGLADVVTHGVTGWLFEPGDAAELSGILRRVERPAVKAMGRLARRTFEQQYTAEIFRENLWIWWKPVLEP